MRDINALHIHCAATIEGRDVSVDTIRKGHLKRGFSDVGYHHIIALDGVLFDGRPIEKIPASVKGHNTGAVAICYIGGLDKNGKPKDTRTGAQKATMEKLVKEYVDAHPIKEIKGHRDYSPDKNKDGKIDKWEWIKSCPCFSVADWLKEIGLKV